MLILFIFINCVIELWVSGNVFIAVENMRTCLTDEYVLTSVHWRFRLNLLFYNVLVPPQVFH